MEYDVIVIGSGNGGLISALSLQKEGKKVLLLEKNNIPGGLATSFKKGRFEFEASLSVLGEYGTASNPGRIRKLFQKLNIEDKIEVNVLDEALNVLVLDTSEQYYLPANKEDFISKMEEYVPSSKDSIEKLLDLCEEVHESLGKIETMDLETFSNTYPNILDIATINAEKGLEKLKIPNKAKNILESFWLYLNGPMKEVSFIEYLNALYSFVILKNVIPKNTSASLSYTIYEEFLKLGGKSKMLTKVKEILVENNKVVGVKTCDGKEYLAKVVISNASMPVVYGSLIDEKNVPRKARALCNARTLGARNVCVYLGLNKSKEQLGLDKTNYTIYHTLDSSKEFERMKHLKGDNIIATVYDSNDENLKNTTRINLVTYLFSNTFDDVVTKENYFDLKNAFAENMIDIFEQATNIKIRDYIEEIVISTPLTFARYTTHPLGVTHGFQSKALDNLLPRVINNKNEDYIDGLYFVGGFGPYLSGYAGSYLSGVNAKYKAIDYLKEAKVENEKE